MRPASCCAVLAPIRPRCWTHCSRTMRPLHCAVRRRCSARLTCSATSPASLEPHATAGSCFGYARARRSAPPMRRPSRGPPSWPVPPAACWRPARPACWPRWAPSPEPWRAPWSSCRWIRCTRRTRRTCVPTPPPRRMLVMIAVRGRLSRRRRRRRRTAAAVPSWLLPMCWATATLRCCWRSRNNRRCMRPQRRAARNRSNACIWARPISLRRNRRHQCRRCCLAWPGPRAPVRRAVGRRCSRPLPAPVGA